LTFSYVIAVDRCNLQFELGRLLRYLSSRS